MQPFVEILRPLVASVVTRWRQRAIISRGGSTLRLLNVTESDAGVLQCNASNEHGFVFANVHLNVHGQSALTLSIGSSAAIGVLNIWRYFENRQIAISL